MTCLESLGEMDARYITRAVLVPFSDVSEMSATERMEADDTVLKAMKKAGRAAGIMVALGNVLLSPESSECLKVIVQRVETVLTNHRLVLSYSWLLLATFKLLEAVGKMTPDMEELMWQFFTEDVMTAVNNYQLRAVQSQQQLKKEDVEELLCEAVSGEETSKVLTFLRTNRKLRGQDVHWYAILACELRKHLQSRGIPLPATFTSSLKKLCHGYLREGVLQLFLAPNTALQYVPAGVEGRQSPSTIYARAIMVQKEFFTKRTAQILDEAAGEVIESPKRRRLLNRRHVSCGDDLQEAGRSKRSRNKRKSTRESESSPGKKQRLSSRGSDVHREPGDREATPGAMCSPEKNRRLSHMRLSDSEQEAGQAEPVDRETTPGAMCSPEKNRRVSHMRPSDSEQEATQGAMCSPEKNRRVSHMRPSDSEQEAGQAEPVDREATQGAMCSPKKNRRVSHMRPSDSEQEAGQAEPVDREATQGAMCSPKKNRRLSGLAEPGDREAIQGSIESPKRRRLLNRRHVSCGDDLQEAGRSKRSRNKRKSTRESESSPGKKQRLSSRGSDVHREPGDREATQGAMCSPEKNRRLSGLAEPGDREAIQRSIESPRKRRLSNLRYVSRGDDLQEAGRSKRSRTKGKSTQESESPPGKKQRLSSRGLDVHREPGDREATQGATRSPEKNRTLFHMRPSDSEQEAGQAEPGDREATQGAMRSPEKNRRVSHMRPTDSEQEAGQAEPGDREATQGAMRSPKKNRRVSHMRPSDGEQEAGQAEPGDREATQGAMRSPDKNRRLSHMRPSDGEQEADQAEPGDREATQGAMRSPDNNRRVSHMKPSDGEQEAGQAEPGDREAIQGDVESPKRRRLSNRRHVSRGDDLQEAGRSKRSRNKRKSTQESELSPGKKQRLSSRGSDVHREPGDREATQEATRSPEKNRTLSHMKPSDSEQEAGQAEQEASQAEPGDREATQGPVESPKRRRLSNRRHVSDGDDLQEAGRSKRSRNKRKSTQESESSPGKKQRLSSRGSDVHCEPGDRKATQEATRSPEKNRTLSHMKPSDSEQEAGQVEPGDCEASQGTMRSPENRRLSGLAEPGDQEAIEGSIESPRKRRLSNLRYVSRGDNLQEAGRSKRSRTKGKSTQESESSPGKKQRLSSTRPDVHGDSGEGDPFRKALKNLIQINRTDTTVNKETSARGKSGRNRDHVTIPEDELHCQECGGKFKEKESHLWVGCEAIRCWRWWHYTCVGLSRLPEQDEKWMCRICNPPSGSGICKL